LIEASRREKTNMNKHLWLCAALAAFGCDGSDDTAVGGDAGAGGAGGQALPGGEGGTGGAGGQALPGGEGGAGGTGGAGGQALPGGEGGAGGAGGATPPADVLFSHFPDDCQTLVSLIPAPGEAGQFGLARITPPSWPYEVTAVEYEMFNGVRGDGTTNSVAFDQRVLVFRGLDAEPVASPEFLQDSTVPAAADFMGDLYKVTLPLETAVRLEEGEHLFVAIDLPSDMDGQTSAIAACQHGPTGSIQEYPADRYYWGASLDAPFAWTPLAGFGLDLWLDVAAWGHPVE
jgi:hypothetical protein